MTSSLTLRPLLQMPFSGGRYAAILQDILPSGTLQLLQTPQPIAAKCDDVTRTDQIGSIELPDGNTIALLEVHVADQIKLARNRVALRNFVARFIDEASTTAVLAVFHQQGKPDWRLTYACKRSQIDDDTLEITSTQTAPRRYTFLLGENEPCRTAAGRLAELRERGEHLTLEEVEKAFSVERLNKDFFKDYKKHYETFVAYLLAPENAKATRTAFGIATHKDKAEQDKADKPIRDFVKRLLGRLVFLHFLQKKGWMGCPKKVASASAERKRTDSPKGEATLAWTGGDPDFLASYFALAESKKDAHRFHSQWLIPLFFEALNNAERPGDLFPPTGTRIPYLNGGLFETDPAPLHALDFPAGHFRALLEFFGQYHFTIDENDPEDHEVGIDPEMLGHIFENLLEDNKDKGAYYTPKAIVSYMARQSLLHYLQTHLGENAELAVLLNEKDTAKHTDKDSFVRQNAKRIADLLDAVKICDPAIGSGAFPIGVLQEILWTRLTLNWELNTPEERAKLKRRIIQNSIHGVDLDPGAVEIARLRFWLALVVDEDQPRPLPNLDYKIHRADSLIEYIRGEPVHLGKVSAEDKRTHGAIQSLIAAKAALFTAQRVPEKRAARFALYRALAEVAIAEFTWLRNDMGLIADDAERAAQLDSGLKEFGHRIKLIDSVAKESAKTQDHVLAELRAWFDDDQKPTFLWQLHFGEVFAQGGFDIVIANPPYVRTKGIPSEVKEELWQRFETFVRKADLYVCFLEQALGLAKARGVVCFITSSSYLRLDSFELIRQQLLKRTAIRELIEFQENVFESAAVRTAILIAQPTMASGSIAASIGDDARSALCQNRNSIEQRVWSEAPRNIFDLASTSILDRIRRKILDGGSAVSSLCEVSFGLKTGDDSKFISKQPFAHHNQRLLRGRDICKYRLRWNGEYVCYDTAAMREHRKTARPGTSERFEQPKVLVRDTGDVLEAAFDAGNCYVKDVLILIAKPRIDYPLQAITALLNSLAVRFFYETTYQTIHVQQNELASIPIPPATAADKARLSQLAEACAAAAQRGDEATLAVHEAEIDQIVYRLFDLTPDEIALIESALTPTRTTTPKRQRTPSGS